MSDDGVLTLYGTGSRIKNENVEFRMDWKEWAIETGMARMENYRLHRRRCFRLGLHVSSVRILG